MTGEARRVRSRSLLFLFCAALAMYLASISRNLSLAHDSITYINDLDAGVNLFHPHHLLYHVAAFGWLRLWRQFGVSAPSEVIVAALNSVFGALTLCILYLFARHRLRLDRGAASLAVGLPAVSFGFWFYSAVVEVYLPALFFMAWTAYLLAGDDFDSRLLARVGLLHAVGTLFHQLNILFVPVVAVLLVFRGRGQRWRLALSYARVYIPVVGIPYVLVPVLFLGIRSAPAYLYWVTFYAHLGYWSPPGPATLAKACVGAGRAVLGSHFLLALDPVRARILGAFGHNFLADEQYLVRDLPRWLARGLFWTWLATLVAGAAGAVVAARRWRATWRGHAQAVAPLLLWLAVYSLFFVFWVPFNPEFWIPQSVCGWLLLAGLWWAPAGDARAPKARLVLPGVLLALVAVVNLLGSMVWVRGTEHDYYYNRARDLARLTRPGDLVILGRTWVWGPYVTRLAPVRPLALDAVLDTFPTAGAYLREVGSRVDSALRRGGRVLVSQEAVAFEPEVVRQANPALRSIGRLWDRYRGSWQRVEMPLDTVYVISPPVARPAAPPATGSGELRPPG